MNTHSSQGMHVGHNIVLLLCWRHRQNLRPHVQKTIQQQKLFASAVSCIEISNASDICSNMVAEVNSNVYVSGRC